MLLGPLVGLPPERALGQPAGQLLDDLEQLERAERLADERVGTCGTALFVARVGGAGEQHDRYLGRGRLSPQTAAERDAVHVGQGDVEHDHVGRALRQPLHGLGRAAGLVDLDVDDLECRPQQHAEVRLVVDDEDANAALPRR